VIYDTLKKIFNKIIYATILKNNKIIGVTGSVLIAIVVIDIINIIYRNLFSFIFKNSNEKIKFVITKVSPRLNEKSIKDILSILIPPFKKYVLLNITYFSSFIYIFFYKYSTNKFLSL
jgi:hypothetical protein